MSEKVFAKSIPLLLQHSSALTMALGKKSFLIRDILESSQSVNRCSQNILQWILQNNPTNQDNSSSETEYSMPSNFSELCDGGRDLNEHRISSPQAIESLMLLSNNYTNIRENENLSRPTASMLSSRYPISEYQPFFPVQSAQLYQNLYYYALQQQFNTSIGNRVNESSIIEDCSSTNHHSVNYSAHSKESLKIKFKRSLLENPVTRKRKPPKGNLKIKKANVEADNIERSVPNDANHDRFDANADWLGKQEFHEIDGEIKCHCNETDFQEHNNKCDARSKYKKLRNRRNRTVFTERQLMALETRFDSQKYLSTPDRADLARALGLTSTQLKTWLQNRRMKWKKQVMQNGCTYPPTKPKGRPKKDSIPTYGIEYTNSLLSPIFSPVTASSSGETFFSISPPTISNIDHLAMEKTIKTSTVLIDNDTRKLEIDAVTSC